MKELEELTAILEDLNEARSFKAAAERLTRWAKQLTGCQAAILRLLEDNGTPWLAGCAVDGHSERFVRDEAIVHTSECICGRVATGAVDPSRPFYTPGGSFHWGTMGTLTKEFTPEEVGNLRGRCQEEGYESLAVFPVKAGRRPIGSLHLADQRPHAFDERIAIVEAACRLAGNNLLGHRTRERDRALLETVGTALLPAMPTEVSGVDLGVSFVSATEMARVGGDFYDIYDLGPGGVLLLVGDVSGKGLEALGLATQARYTIESQTTPPVDPANLLTRANKVLLDILPPRRFVTAAACLIDWNEKTVTTCLAGHPAPAVLTSAGATEIEAPHNPPLGLFEGVRFAQVSCPLDADQVLLLYTDGVTDARQAKGLFGLEGVTQAARSIADAHPQYIAETICRAASDYHDHRYPGDDRLVLAARLARTSSAAR